MWANLLFEYVQSGPKRTYFSASTVGACVRSPKSPRFVARGSAGNLGAVRTSINNNEHVFQCEVLASSAVRPTFSIPSRAQLQHMFNGKEGNV